jgi:deoxyribose-phosphate aldolase
MTLNRTELAALVDHTLLSPTATLDDVAALVAEARELGTYSICISPSFLPLALDLGAVKLATVCGFPSGKHTAQAKAFEAAQSVANGADEVDMVIDVGRLIAGDAAHTEREIRAVRDAMDAEASGRVLKVIIESAALSDDQIVAACVAAEDAGADFVKTSTGFHPAGGASEHAIALMARTVGSRLGVKASGGIRSWEAAQTMADAGATRLGLSGTRAVLDGATAAGDY